MPSVAPPVTSPVVAAPPLEVRGLWVAYPGASEAAVRDVTLAVERGSLVAIVGPNGGGKSTFVKAILGLLPPLRGEVRLFGQPLKDVRQRIGYVPQTEQVDWRFPVSVFDVALMGRYGRLGLFRRPGREDRERAREALELVGMLPLADRQIGALSGGQQQRVFLARALAGGAELLVLDEPMSGVDIRTEDDIFALLARLRGQGVTVLMTTHDLACVAERFDRVILLNRTVLAYGPAETVLTEANLEQTYGGHLGVVRVGDRYVALEDSAHHGHADRQVERGERR